MNKLKYRFLDAKELETKKEQPIKLEESLAYLYPVIAEYFHPEKNKKTAYEVSGKILHSEYWWRCNEGHEWIAFIKSLLVTKNDICPICGKRTYEYSIL